MRTMIYTILILLMSTRLVSCGKSESDEGSRDSDDFIGRISGEAYLGAAKSRLYLGGYDGLPSVEGQGSFSLGKIAGDSATIVLTVTLSTADGFSLGIPGKQNGKAWKATFENGAFRILANGEMSGSLETNGQEISWEGRLFDDRLMLDVRMKYLEQQDNITAGSILHTHLDLKRFVESAETTAGGCKSIVWQNRAIPNLFSGGVDIMSVPVCNSQ